MKNHIDVTINSLKIKLFCDGANLEGILAMYRTPWIKGFTTNPTLMRKAGIHDYEDSGAGCWPKFRTVRCLWKYSQTSSTAWKRRRERLRPGARM